MDAITSFAITRDERIALKQAIDAAIEQCGGVTSAAMHCRADASVLSRSRNQEHLTLPSIGDAIAIDRASGKHDILDAMAKALGCKVVPLNERHRLLSLTREAGLAAREAGEAVSAITEAEADNVVTATEARLADRAAVAAIDRFTKIREGLTGFLVRAR